MSSAVISRRTAGCRRGGARVGPGHLAVSVVTSSSSPPNRRSKSSVLVECGRTVCTRICLDRSRGARRTWCGMDECGNRVKAAAYRARRRSSTVGDGGAEVTA
ncbi:CGNR zinc finger domain-containing protein [Streptomyces hebeiensis]